MKINLLYELKRSYSVIKRHLDSDEVSDWLSDNFYCIDKHYKALLGNKTALRCGEFYAILKNYFQQKDCNSSPESLKKWLSAQSRSYNYFELSSVRGLLALCAITQISAALTDKKESHTLPNSVKTLHRLSHPEYDDIIANLWSPERLLSRFEADYERFDLETKSQYREKIAYYARKRKTSEADACEELIFEAKSKKIPLGSLLLAPKARFAALWGAIIALCFLILSLFAASFVGFSGVIILSIAFAVTSCAIADRVISAILPPHRAPRLELNKVPDDAKTLVTVACLLSGKRGDDAVFDSLSKFRYMSPDKNIYFCLLADFPDSDTQNMPTDKAVAESARAKIDELNRIHGDCFCLYLRERVMNKSEGRFGGRERKRGAVCDLVSYILHGEGDEYYGGDFIREIKYILTLDSDTNLSVGSVRELLSIALHPVNRPILRDGRVVSGYGIIQPSVRTELKSAYNTGFSRLLSGSGGVDNYSGATFVRSQSMFGSGLFCGKGLIDVRLFSALASRKLPDGVVLSHDILEGSLLNTLAASDVTLTDSIPSNTVSFFRRQHRWMRGDFQNLRFLKGKILKPFSKYRLLLIGARHLSPIFTVTALAIGCFIRDKSGFWMFLLAFSEFIIPSCITFFAFFANSTPFACRRFFSKAVSMLTQTAIRLFFEISSTLRRAVLTLNACVLAIYRSIKGRKTLEWTTASQIEKLGTSFGKYALDGGPSAVIGLLMLIFAMNPAMRIAGLLFFVYPLASVILSHPINGGQTVKNKLSEKQKRLLTAHARDMVSFYFDNVNESTNYLPPDNIQASPVSDKAMRTSPTNIGFYLVSLLASRDLEMITTKTLCDKLNQTLDVIEQLEKHKGNLYNWYDLTNKSVIGDYYLSAVDSGNFVVMLVALYQGLCEFSGEDEGVEHISERIKALIENTDLTIFYDDRKRLFRIGLAGREHSPENSYYDMLMSEARMTSYFAVATGAVDKKHWQSLCRTLTHYKGYIGMTSWSGTAFEYLMPQLFMPLYRDSFIFESVSFALMVQRDYHTPWGISESGFYSFDSEMHYQYKANGVQRLALRRTDESEKIVSPYSTYLSLCLLSGEALKNLDYFENRGMYGRYGLYEALDFNCGDGLIVKSYMAHHVGMSIIACVNAVLDNIFVRRFMEYPYADAGAELLQERIPNDAHIFGESGVRREEARTKSRMKKSLAERSDLSKPMTALISRGDLSLIVSSSGHIGINCGDKMICNTQFTLDSLRFSPHICFSRSGSSFGCTPLYGNDSSSFEIGQGYASQISSGGDFSGRIRYSIAEESDCIVISTRAESLKKYDVTLAFEPVLQRKKDFTSHISFSRLFIESELDRQRNILFFHRRSRHDGSHIFSIAVALKEKELDFEFLTSRESLKAFSVNSPLDYATVDADNRVGACIDPICLLRVRDCDGGRATFLIACGATKQECINCIKLARRGRGDFSSPRDETTERILPYLLYNKSISLSEKLGALKINDLWKYSISGDFPIVCAYVEEPSTAQSAALIKSYLTLKRLCNGFELVFVVNERDSYSRPIEGTISETISRLRASQYFGLSGGIFILREREIGREFFDMLKKNSNLFIDFSQEIPPFFCDKIDLLRVEADVNYPSLLAHDGKATQTKHGYFGQDCFIVDKKNLPDAPYSFILTGRRFSTVVTSSGLGYTFFDNSRERRLCSFYGDAKTLDIGERVIAEIGGKNYDLCAVSGRVYYGKGQAVYEGNAGGIDYKVTVTVPPKYPVKLIYVEYQQSGAKTRFCIKPVMGDLVAPTNTLDAVKASAYRNEGFIFRNALSMTFPEGYGFAGVCGGRVDRARFELESDSSNALFFLGATTSEGGALKIFSGIDMRFFENSLDSARDFAESMIPKIFVKTETEHDKMMNFFLPYQVAACRFFARGSFYQSGGAYGFRDQLQDCLTLVYSMPWLVQRHIIRCCAHQYLDGSVMHWWHTRVTNGVNNGIRSKCSDDMLYLPFVVADYIEKTDDSALLDLEIEYLDSPPLGDLSERYELPYKSGVFESVYLHCLKALEYADKRGKHGLLLMGSCDWNDAFSLVGEKGIGESVFSTLLYIVSAEKFLPLVEKRGDVDAALKLKNSIEILRENVENNAFFGDRYARAFCDDGSVLGVDGCGECEIDILSQAFASLARLDRERTKNALKLAFSKLYDEKAMIFKLFSPPFANNKTKVGYIRGYVEGIRENGGQYSHGALWGALGCINAGLYDEAKKILDCINPIIHASDSRYKNEPYAVSADIYSGEYSGRGGWSWYTGAASWYYRIMLENVLGIRLGANQTIISAKPIIEYEMNIELCDCSLKIQASKAYLRDELDGNDAIFPLKLPSGEHILRLTLK